jgi:hypothetical protein
MNPSQEKNTKLIAIAALLANIPWCEQYERMVSGMLQALHNVIAIHAGTIYHFPLTFLSLFLYTGPSP